MTDSKDGISDAAVIRIMILVLLGVVAIVAKFNSFYGQGTVYNQPPERLAQSRRDLENRVAVQADAAMDDFFAKLDQERKPSEPESVPEQPIPTAALPTQGVVQPNGEIPRIRELLVDGELPEILPALMDGTFSKSRTKDEQLEFADDLMRCASYSQLRVMIEDEFFYGADANVWRDVSRKFLDGSFGYRSSSNLRTSPHLYEHTSDALKDELYELIEAQNHPETTEFFRGNDSYCILLYAIIASGSKQ